MSNYVKKQNNNLTKSINPFKEDFSNTNESEDNNSLAQTFQNINNDKFHKDILGDQTIENETAFESKIRQQISDKSMNSRNSIHFYSGKNVNRIRESLKDLGIFSEEYLTLRKIKKLSQKEYDDLKNSIIDTNSLTKLYNTLKNVNCNFKSSECNSSVGGITPLTYLIENAFAMDSKQIKEMNDKYNILKNYIYNYRAINGDGNCFYRAVMFRYFEILVLNENIEYLQNVIYDIVESFKSEEVKARINIRGLNIKPDLTFKVLILIVDLLKNKMKEEAYQILVKSFSTSNKFDYGIILYFRYILYDYIRKNENKAYTKSFPIKLGNLLPRQFETSDGQFLFNSFYQNYLLNFFTDSEKIIIYLTPLVLDIELNIIIFDDCEEDILQKFKFEGNSELKTLDIISLLNKKNHYEIIYSLKDYEKNKNIFVNYENNKKSVILSNADNLIKNININDSNFNLLKESFNDINIEQDFNSKTMIYNKKSIFNNNKVNQNNNKKFENKKNETNKFNLKNINTKVNNNHEANNDNQFNKNIENNFDRKKDNYNNHKVNYNNNSDKNKVINNNGQNNPIAYNNNNNNENNTNNNKQINPKINDFIGNKINFKENSVISYNHINNNYNVNNNSNQINCNWGNINNNSNTSNNQINKNNGNINENYNINNNQNKQNYGIIYNTYNERNDNKNLNNNSGKYNNYNRNQNINRQNYYSNQANSGNPGQIINQNNFSRRSKYLNNNILNNNENNKLNQKHLNQNNEQQYSNYKSNIPIHHNDILNPKTEGNRSKYNYGQNNSKINSINRNNFNNKINPSFQQQNNNIGLKTPGNNFNQSKISSNSNLTNTSQLGLITPGQIKNQNKIENICINCKKTKIDNPNINICKFCFKSKIINELYSYFLVYIESNEDPMNIDIDIEIKLKKNESPRIFKLDQAIEEYNKNYKNEFLNKSKIINELKKKVCILCQKDINKESYEIPCKCHFCCKDHLIDFLNSDKLKGFICFYCKQKYSDEMLFKLGVLSYNFNAKQKYSIRNYFFNKLKNICCVCRIKTDDYYSKNIISSLNQNQKDVDIFLSQLIHYFCKSCYINKVNNNQHLGFTCTICKVKHYIKENNNN